VAAQFKEQQRPLGRSREGNIMKAGPYTSRPSPLPAAHTALVTCMCSACYAFSFAYFDGWP